MGMLSAALWRHVGNSPFEDLQKGLLYAFTGYISGNRRILVFSTDLIDLINVNDSLLALLYIAVGSLKQLQNDVFDVFAYIPGFGQRRGIHNRERNVQDSGQR